MAWYMNLYFESVWEIRCTLHTAHLNHSIVSQSIWWQFICRHRQVFLKQTIFDAVNPVLHISQDLNLWSEIFAISRAGKGMDLIQVITELNIIHFATFIEVLVESLHARGSATGPDHGKVNQNPYLHVGSMMIGVPTHGIYFGHSMPPTLPKSPQIEYIYKNIIKKYIFQNFTIYIYIIFNL